MECAKKYEFLLLHVGYNGSCGATGVGKACGMRRFCQWCKGYYSYFFYIFAVQIMYKYIYPLVLVLFLATRSYAQPLPERAVEPLLNTVRVQSAPFNNSCPYYNYGDSVSSERCLVGCVATAIEQLLSFYRYPEALLDSIPGWETDNYSLATVPAGSVIDWDDVADLSLWCGMIVQMKYSPNASASGMWKAEEPLRRVFGYKTVRVMDRSLYSFDAWHRILQNELMCGRPVAYVGYNNVMGGHAFNIDGVDENGFYHCNWGEGEHQNGYFSLEHLCQMQPHWDATDWGRMVGYHANEYMLLLHPDSVADVLDPDTLADFAHAVRVDSISFRRQMTNREYVLTDVTLTNLSADTLYHTYEVLLNSPSDTSILEQCREIALSSVKLFPGETRTQAVACHYPAAPGEWLVSLTFDGLEVAYTKRVQAVSPTVEQLSFKTDDVSFPQAGSVKIQLQTHNSAKEGTAGRLLYYRLYEAGKDYSCSMDYRFLNLPFGESACDTLCFNRLKPGTDYVLRIGGWSSTMHTVAFTMPGNSTGITDCQDDANAEKHPDGILYDMKGRVVLCPEKGIYIRNGKKVYYEGRRDN